MDFASIVRQGGKQQGAVADAFGTGQGDGGGFERGGGEADGFGHDGRLGSGNRKRHYTAGRGRLKNMAAAIRSLQSLSLNGFGILNALKHGKVTSKRFVDARNLANRTARPQNSMLKYIAPQSGRSVRVGVRMNF